MLTKAEAICACTNIIDLAEELDERLPDSYSRSVHDKISDMRQFITDKWRGDNVTEKMDAAIRNTWAGLRKWDRNDEHNDNLFYGLEEVEVEATPPPETVKVPEEATPVEISEEDQAKLDAMSEKSRKKPAPTPETLPEKASEKTAAKPAPPAGISATELSRAREACLDSLRNQHLHAIKERKSMGKAVLFTVDDLKHGNLYHVLSKTSSDRSQQLIHAAYIVGQIAGINSLHEELKK